MSLWYVLICIKAAAERTSYGRKRRLTSVLSSKLGCAAVGGGDSAPGMGPLPYSDLYFAQLGTGSLMAAESSPNIDGASLPGPPVGPGSPGESDDWGGLVDVSSAGGRIVAGLDFTVFFLTYPCKREPALFTICHMQAPHMKHSIPPVAARQCHLRSMQGSRPQCP